MSKDVPWLVGKVRLFSTRADFWIRSHFRFPVLVTDFLLHISFCCVLGAFLLIISCSTMSLLGRFEDYWNWRYRFNSSCTRTGVHSHSLKDGHARMRIQFFDARSCARYQRMLTCLMSEAERINRLPGNFGDGSLKTHDAMFWLYHCHDFRNRFGEVLVPSMLREHWNATERALRFRATVWSINVDHASRTLNCRCVSPPSLSAAE